MLVQGGDDGRKDALRDLRAPLQGVLPVDQDLRLQAEDEDWFSKTGRMKVEISIKNQLGGGGTVL
jgi:hypothetical protein